MDKICVLTKHYDNITGATFQINNAKLYAALVTLYINDDIKILENIKQGIKIEISQNKYRSEITTQTKNSNLDDLINPTFRNIHRLFMFSFKKGSNGPTRNHFDEYYMPLKEIKKFNAFIDNKPFFDQPAKSKQEAYEKIFEISRNDDYKTDYLLGYQYHHKHYKFVGIDSSRQTNINISQQINFIGKLEEDDGSTMLLMLNSSKKLFQPFPQIH